MDKIIFYIGSILRSGGAERVMTNLVNYFFERGYEVLLITDVSDKEGNAEYPINKAIKRITIGGAYKNTVINNLFRIKRLRKCVKNYRPMLVVSFMGRPNIRMILSTIGLPCKKVISVRNDPNREYGSGIKRLFTNWLFLLANGYVFQTDRVGMYFNKKINKHSIVIANPVNNSFFQKKWYGNEKIITCIGRLEAQKNHALLLKAFSEICDDIPEYLLVLCGDGSQKSNLKQKSRELGIEDRIKFIGEIVNIEDILSRTSLFILPSDFEGMPNALMEAMAVGVPCIATDCPVGGPAMLFSKDLSEYLVPCGDDKELASLMLKILTLSENERQKIGEKMKSHAKAFYPEKVYSEWEEYLKWICLN